MSAPNVRTIPTGKLRQKLAGARASVRESSWKSADHRQKATEHLAAVRAECIRRGVPTE